MSAMSTRNTIPSNPRVPSEKEPMVLSGRKGVLGSGPSKSSNTLKNWRAKIYCEIVGYGNPADANHMRHRPRG